ncbi:CG0192-related protein [Mumia sp. DW29H23]|uniref:CG0192-related protein n=1 Tax=Mumia sp. DW29H23 TaxID=3421241 RepID=UPI003D687C2D
MAHIHRAEIRPTKLELLDAWVPAQPWAIGVAGPLSRLGAYRFDDPDGEVGIETLLVASGEGPVLQVPLTYRGAPLEGAEPSLVGTMEHSVLGSRWVYDGCGDPVYVQAVLAAMLTGGQQADEMVETDDGLVRREPTTFVTGSGSAGASVPQVLTPVPRSDATQTVVDAGRVTIVVRRVLAGTTEAEPATYALRGRWPGQDDDVVLVTA